jgi:hypothetical protein
MVRWDSPVIAREETPGRHRQVARNPTAIDALSLDMVFGGLDLLDLVSPRQSAAV